MATRMLWFEVMPPFAIYNHIKITASEKDQRDFDQDGGNKNQLDTRRVLRFQAEFVDIDIILDEIRNKTLTMQKYFNHPNRTFTYKENDVDYFLSQCSLYGYKLQTEALLQTITFWSP